MKSPAAVQDSITATILWCNGPWIERGDGSNKSSKSSTCKFLPPHWPSTKPIKIVASACWGSTTGSVDQPMSFSGFQVKATGKAREQSR
jgi:hypothetical protein